MLESLFTKRDIAQFHHRLLPQEIRRYLNGRGIPDSVINAKLLGWNGRRITIPVFGREGEVLSFRYAKSPKDETSSPKMLSDKGATPELYGWETLARNPHRVIICEGEFDRLVLEARGFPAVTSTAGASVFLPEWEPHFNSVRYVYACFDRDKAGEAGAKRVRAVLPQVKIVKLPAEVGDGGDVTDFFVRLGKGRIDFEILLANAAAADSDDAYPSQGEPTKDRPPSVHKAIARRAERLKRSVALSRIVRRYTGLTKSGDKLVGRCPFHEDTSPSFTVYPETDTYFCFGCRAHGDVIKFLEDKESITYGQALEALERFLHTDELF